MPREQVHGIPSCLRGAAVRPFTAEKQGMKCPYPRAVRRKALAVA